MFVPIFKDCLNLHMVGRNIRLKNLIYLLPVAFFALVLSVEVRKLIADEQPLNDSRIENLLLQTKIEYFHAVLAFLVQPFWATGSLDQLQHELHRQIDPKTRTELTRRLGRIYIRLDRGGFPPLLLPAGWEIAKGRAFNAKCSILGIIAQDDSAEAFDFFVHALATADAKTMQEVSAALLSSKVPRPQLYDKITEANQRGLLPDLRRNMHHILMDTKRGRSETQDALLNTTDSAVIQNLLGRYVEADYMDAYAFVFDTFYKQKTVRGGSAGWKSSVCAGLGMHSLSEYMLSVEDDRFHQITPVVLDLGCLMSTELLSVFEEKLKTKNNSTKLAVIRLLGQEVPKWKFKYSNQLLDGSIVLVENTLKTDNNAELQNECRKALSYLRKAKITFH